MSAALSAGPRTGFKFMLTVKAGPDVGASYQLLPPRVTIGRGTESNVSFADPRVSRQAAVIEFTPEKIIIRDLTTRDSLSVNGKTTKEASIKDGDLVRIGETEFVFIVEAVIIQPPSQVPATIQPSGFPSAQPQLSIAPASFPPPNFGGAGRTSANYQTSQARPGSSSDAGRVRFYMMLAVMGGIVAWLMTTTNKAKPVDQELRTTEVIERDIKGTEERIVDLEKKRNFKSDEERTRYEEAQKHYLQGFRDYQKGQWHRAMKSFETARAIDPDHQLALRYYKLSEKQRDEMIALLTLEGRSYKDKNMYRRCSAAFEKVLDAIPNKDDVKFKQAESLKKECDLMSEEKFR